jgi:hypothetical protein
MATLPEPIEQIAENATDLRPRSFAMYGVDVSTGRPFLGWGMADDARAFYYEPESDTHDYAATAEQILRHIEERGAAHLVWLTD